MAQKHVLFTFNNAPYGSIWYTEGLRAAVGATSGIDEHTVDLVYLGDGVYFTLKDVDRTDSARYLGTLTKGGYRLKAERESLEARGISAADLAEDVEVISRADVVELVKIADLTIDF
ncbi:MAG: DsrE family protein [Chloroflexi bacterium]|nr:DsrE family protein [Chloroflexota bacterium]